jgi:hypothetical protein
MWKANGRTTDAYPWQKLTWPMARWAKKYGFHILSPQWIPVYLILAIQQGKGLFHWKKHKKCFQMVFDTLEIGDKLWLIDDNFYLGGMMFNATFKNISVISWRSVFFPSRTFFIIHIIYDCCRARVVSCYIITWWRTQKISIPQRDITFWYHLDFTRQEWLLKWIFFMID